MFIAGFADTDTIVAGRRLDLALSRGRIVGVLERDAFPAELLTTPDRGSSIANWVTVGELIDDPRLLRFSTEERLGTVLMARVDKLRSAADTGAVLEHLLSGSAGSVTDESAIEFARFLIKTVTDAGLVPEPRLTVTRPKPLDAAPRTTIGGRILDRFPPLAGTNPITYAANVGEFVNEVPLRFAELGLDLNSKEGRP